MLPVLPQLKVLSLHLHVVKFSNRNSTSFTIIILFFGGGGGGGGGGDPRATPLSMKPW